MWHAVRAIAIPADAEAGSQYVDVLLTATMNDGSSFAFTIDPIEVVQHAILWLIFVVLLLFFTVFVGVGLYVPY